MLIPNSLYVGGLPLQIGEIFSIADCSTRVEYERAQFSHQYSIGKYNVITGINHEKKRSAGCIRYRNNGVKS